MMAESVTFGQYLLAAALTCAPAVPVVIMFVGDFRKRQAARVRYSSTDAKLG
jgi:hypothetical protein